MSPSVNTYVTLFSTGIQRPLDPKFSYILKLYLTVKRCQNAQTLISGMTVLACPSISCPITMSHPTQRWGTPSPARHTSTPWLTDQVYTGGIAEEFRGIGPVTNAYNKNLKQHDRCGYWCVKSRQPWAAPGQAPRNLWRQPRRMPSSQGRPTSRIGLWTNFTMIKSRSGDEPRGSGTWEKLEQIDLREGTHPEKSVWRPFGKVVRKSFVIRYFANLIRWRKIPCCLFIRKDSVRVPADLPVGDYVLSLCWDVWGGAQVAFPLYSISCFLQQIWCSFDQNLFLGRFGCLVLQSDWWTSITRKMTVRFLQRRNMWNLRAHLRIKSISLSPLMNKEEQPPHLCSL